MPAASKAPPAPLATALPRPAPRHPQAPSGTHLCLRGDLPDHGEGQALHIGAARRTGRTGTGGDGGVGAERGWCSERWHGRPVVRRPDRAALPETATRRPAGLAAGPPSTAVGQPRCKPCRAKRGHTPPAPARPHPRATPPARPSPQRANVLGQRLGKHVDAALHQVDGGGTARGGRAGGGQRGAGGYGSVSRVQAGAPTLVTLGRRPPALPAGLASPRPTARCRRTLQPRRAAQHSTAQHGAAQHSTVEHSTAQHSTAQHGATQHSAQRTAPRPPGPWRCPGAQSW